ncbi:MAG: hypothetical protein AB7I50_01115 [Vicinamibacterales bacterium]
MAHTPMSMLIQIPVGRLLLALAFVACCFASPARAADGDEATVLKETATKFWNARIQDEWGVVFDLLPEEEQAAIKDREAYATYQKEKGWFKYEKVDIGESVVDRHVGWVDVGYESSLRLYPTMPHQEVKMWQIWRKTDQWRPVPQPLLNQFPQRPPTLRPVAEEAVIGKRVEALWKARKEQDWGTVYDLSTPEYRKSIKKKEFLKRRSKYQYLRYQLDWVEADGEAARSKVIYTQKLNDETLRKLAPSDEVAFEIWMKDKKDGRWYRYQKPEPPPPPPPAKNTKAAAPAKDATAQKDGAQAPAPDPNAPASSATAPADSPKPLNEGR